MEHTKVVKRAWQILWRHRALWVFGVILALTTVSWESSLLYRDRDDYRYRRPSEVTPPEELPEELEGLGEAIEEMIEDLGGIRPPPIIGALIGIGAAVLSFVLLLYIVARIARYVAEAALIRLVDNYEETGARSSVGRGFQLGWSRTAWRLFLIDLVIDMPVLVAFLLLFALILAPLLLWTTGSTAAGIIGTVLTGGLFFLLLFLVIVVAVAISLLKHFFRRACALEELGVTQSISHGYAVVRQHLGDVGLMWLIMVGVSLAWPFVMAPVAVLLFALALVLGGIPALLLGGFSSLFFAGAGPVAVASAVGIPIFFLVLVVPLVFLGGLREVFQSSCYTLTYRELRVVQEPEPDTSAVDQSSEHHKSGSEGAPATQ